MPRSWVIYTLSDPRNPGAVRYVGITHQRCSKRLAKHLELARKDLRSSHLINWLRKLMASEAKPLMVVIHAGSGDTWGSVESWWISWHRVRGHQLTNATEGGEGCPGHAVTAEARAKIRAAREGKPLSAEHRAKVAAGNRGKKMSPEAIAKSASFWRGRTHNANTKAKISAARSGTVGSKQRPETIAKRVAETRIKMASAEWLDPRRGRPLTSEHRAGIATAKKGYKHSPEAIAKMSASKRARDIERGMALTSATQGSRRPAPS